MSELPAGWSSAAVTDLARFVRGVTYSKTDARESLASGLIGIIRANNIGDFRFDLSDLVYVPERFVSPEQKLQIGDVVIATSSGSVSVVGKAAPVLRAMPFSFGAFCGVFRPVGEMEPRYFGRYFQSDEYRLAASAAARGVNINNLKRSHFDTFHIAFPGREAQLRIADKLDLALSRVEACRARLDRVPQILRKFREAVLQAAVSGRLTEEWRKDNQIAYAWVVTEIQSVSRVGTGSTPLRSHSNYYSESGTPWITSAATSQRIVMAAEKYVTDAAIKAHRLTLYPVGTLLVAMYGEGKTRGQVTELGIDATINQACAAVVVDESIAVRGFVKLALQANYVEMRALAEGGNQPNLNLSKIKEFPLSLPSIPEQNEVVRRVDALFEVADSLQRRHGETIAQGEKLTPSVLAKAFRGELVPQDPNDEPAGEMLERIKKDPKCTMETSRSHNKRRVDAGRKAGISAPSRRQSNSTMS